MTKFMSKCQNQVICMIPSRTQIVDYVAVPIPGRAIRFDRGEFNTEDKKEIDFLRKHRLFNIEITEVEEVKEIKTPAK